MEWKIFLTHGASRHFFERRMLPRAAIEMVQLFPIQQHSLLAKTEVEM